MWVGGPGAAGAASTGAGRLGTGMPRVASQPCSPRRETAERVKPVYVVTAKESIPGGQGAQHQHAMTSCLCFPLCDSGRELGQDHACGGGCYSLLDPYLSCKSFGGAISPCSKVILFPWRCQSSQSYCIRFSVWGTTAGPVLVWEEMAKAPCSSCPAADQLLCVTVLLGDCPNGKWSSFCAPSELLGKLLWIGVAQGKLCQAPHS